MSTTEVAGLVSLAGTAASVAALGYLHVAPTGLSPLRNAVSQYGISPYRAWYRVQTIAMGVAGAALAVAIASALHGSGVAVVVALLCAFAAARLVISWFPMDAPGTPMTATGRRHGLLAIGAFASAPAAAIRLARPLDQAGLSTLCTASRVLGWLMVACLALMLLSRLSVDLRRGLGLSERALYLGIVVWLAVVAAAAAAGHGGALALPLRHVGVVHRG